MGILPYGNTLGQEACGNLYAKSKEKPEWGRGVTKT